MAATAQPAPTPTPFPTPAPPLAAARTGWRGAALNGVLLLLCAASLVRAVHSAASYGIPAWFSEELPPLQHALASGQPVSGIDQRQYGVVVFLALDPWLRFVSPSPERLAQYALVLALLGVLLGYVVVQRRFFRGDLVGSAALFLLWLNAAPTLYVLDQRMVDAWQVLFLSAGLAAFTAGPVRNRALAGVPLALATLTKLLPGLLVVATAIREWRIAVVAAASSLGLLLLGQLLYGPLMGLGYPLALLTSSGTTIEHWSTHYENNSLRGLLYKLAAGFRLRPHDLSYPIPPAWLPWLNLAAYALEAGAVLLLLWLIWRGRSVDSAARRGVEFALAIITMLLVSPHTAHDYTVAFLPVLAVWLYLWRARLPRPWPRPVLVLAVLAVGLVGVYVPFSVFFHLVPIDWLMALTGNSSGPEFTGIGLASPVDPYIGEGIGAYDFFGFPGLGLILAWVVLLWLERASRAPAPAPESATTVTQSPPAAALPAAQPGR